MKFLFTNAKIWTGNTSFTDAVGFDSGTGVILFTGSSDQASKVRNEYDEIIDLGKKLVLPAFTDGHIHFVEGSFESSKLDLRNARTKKDFYDSIKAYRKKNGAKWISGGFFSETNFIEKFIPDRFFLDDICADVPVIISRFDTHSAFINSKALEISGLSNASEKFTRDEIIKDADGSFTGELKERAREFILDKIPPASLSERTSVVIDKMHRLHSMGITAISDITLKEDLDVYRELINRNKLMLRVDARLPFYEFQNIKNYSGEFSQLTDKIKFISLKAFYDGSLSSRTALMHSNYKNSDHNGIKTEFVNSGEFEKMAFEIDSNGLQMSVHAIGDKAITELLDLNEKLIEMNGIRDRRFRIEHAQHIRQNDIIRFKELNVIASVQPTHLFSDAKTAYDILDDINVINTEHNYKKLIDIGAAVCFGTDFPVVSEDPFETIYYAMTRKVNGFEDGFNNELRISLSDCLHAYTAGNAFASYDEKERGRLQPGMKADIVVLEDDLFNMTADEIRNAKVSETYFDGKRVF